MEQNHSTHGNLFGISTLAVTTHIFEARLNFNAGKIFEARLNDYERSGSFHYDSGM
jgi:hypothetical protein